MSFPSKSVLYLLGVVVLGVEAQIGEPCHNTFLQFTPRHGLNITAYMGKWYMQEIAGSDIGNFHAPTYKCSTRSLSLSNGSSIRAVDTYINSTTGATIVESSSAVMNKTRSPFNSMWTMTREQLEFDVIILAVDLKCEEWCLVYSCVILSDGYRYETVTAMTRSPFIDCHLRAVLKAIMVGTGFRIGDHHTIDQTNCPDHCCLV